MRIIDQDFTSSASARYLHRRGPPIAQVSNGASTSYMNSKLEDSVVRFSNADGASQRLVCTISKVALSGDPTATVSVWSWKSTVRLTQPWVCSLGIGTVITILRGS